MTRINHNSTKNKTNHFINTRKKIKIYQKKIYIVLIALENHFQIKISQGTNHFIFLVIEAGHQNKEIQEISHKIDIDQIVKIISIETTIHNQIQTEENFHLIPVPIQTLGIDTIQTIDHETHPTIETGTIPKIEIEAIQIIEISVIRTIDQEIIHTTDPIIKDPITFTIKIDVNISIKRNNSQNRNPNYNNQQKTIPNPLIGIIAVTPIPKTKMEATHPNIKDKIISTYN